MYKLYNVIVKISYFHSLGVLGFWGFGNGKLNKDKDRALEWVKIIIYALNQEGSIYIPVIQKIIKDSLIIMFVNNNQRENISYLKKFKINSGFGGMSGCKGAVAIRFQYEQKSFLFINVYLTDGKNYSKTRAQDLKLIIKETLNDFKEYKHDHIVIFGKMNWRINLSYEHIMECINEENNEWLYEFDQFS